MLEAGRAQVGGNVGGGRGGRGADGRGAKTGGATSASLWRTGDQEALGLCQVLHLMHHTCGAARRLLENPSIDNAFSRDKQLSKMI